MKKLSFVPSVLLIAATTASAGPIFPTTGLLYLAAHSPRVSREESETDVDRVNRATPSPRGLDFVMSTFNAEALSEFRKSWDQVQHGLSPRESVILILRTSTGYQARRLPPTNEYRQLTFAWHPATLAVLHTHPNNCPAPPQPDDIKIADKYQVLMFTLTSRGMFVYDPDTKRTTRVMDGLSWLENASFQARAFNR